MGCVTSCHRRRSKSVREEAASSYSWSNREDIDPKLFAIEDCVDETVVRLHNSINGKPFTISNCLKSNILLLDFLNTVTITDCRDCLILIGPTKGSIMFQNCSNCRIICACMQLRCRDCTDLSFSLYSTTNPSIESCHGLQFSCLTLSYQQLEDQFESAGLCVFNNNWYQIYDFNAFEGDESHWSLIPSLADLDQSLSELEVSKSLEMTADAQRSAVPFTLGIKSSRDFSCLIVLFSDGEEKKRARTLINTLTFLTFLLIRTRRLIVSKILEEQVFQNDEKYSSILFRGPVIALEFSSQSESCCDVAHQEIHPDLASEEVVYVSPSPEAAAEQVELMFNASA